jgi:hypothetical protein
MKKQMKKILYTLALCSLFPFTGGSKEVTPEEAVRVASERGKALAGDDFPSQVQHIRSVEKDGKKCYYIIQFQPEGWALVAADDQASPLLGYSPTGRFYADEQPPAMQGWLDQYATEIKSLASRPIQKRHEAWDRKFLQTRASAKVEPIIQVKWDQSSPFNNYCPKNEKGEKALVGCVAVALAQAMSVFQQPEKPNGRNGYTDDDFGLVNVNYDREAPYNWEAILTASDGNSETARLLYHCGVAVNMDYGKSASGSYCTRIPKALTSYFSYSLSTVKYYKRDSYTGNWTDLIVEELAAGRPVIYDGANDKGTSAHAFNLDGFDGSGSFHVNWGWRGKNNGYFTLENLNDGNFNYLNNHGVVVGIVPLSGSSHVEPAVTPLVRLSAGAQGGYTLESSETGRYRVHDMKGNQVADGLFQAGSQAFMPAASLSPSVYIIIFSYGGKETTQKFIIHTK